MTQDVFRWAPETRVFLGGQPLEQESGTARHETLTILIQAVQQQQSLRVTRDCLDRLEGQGFLECTTAGSTGAPKIIRRSQRSWTSSFEINHQRFGIRHGSAVAIFGELVHSLALYGVLEAAYVGADVHLLSGMRPGAQRKYMAATALDLLYVTPTQLRALCMATSAPPIPSVRTILCGGGALSAADHTAANRLFPSAQLLEFYGASETSFITLADGNTPSGSVGKAYPHVELEVRDAFGQLTEGAGEVWVRSPYLFSGYASGEPHVLHEGFLSVGEMGETDNDGNLYLLGRKDRMITIADQNVFPEEIEAILIAAPGVEACAVLPTADPLRGHQLVAALSGSGTPEASNALRNLCQGQLGPIKTPKRFVWLDDFPILPSGKPDLQVLAARLMQDR